MRTKSVVGVVLCFGLAFTLLAGSGIGGAVFGESPGDETTVDTLEDITEDATVDEDSDRDGLSADVTGDNEPTLVGLSISAGQFAAQLVASVALLPLTLVRLGFPTYFAYPVGGIAQIIAFIGLAQFVIGREWL